MGLQDFCYFRIIIAPINKLGSVFEILPLEPMDAWIKLGYQKEQNTNYMIHMMSKCCKRHTLGGFVNLNV